MKTETQDESIARLTGECEALRMAVSALIAHHPERERVGQWFSRSIDGHQDVTLPTTIPELTRDSMDWYRQRLLEAVTAAV